MARHEQCVDDQAMRISLQVGPLRLASQLAPWLVVSMACSSPPDPPGPGTDSGIGAGGFGAGDAGDAAVGDSAGEGSEDTESGSGGGGPDAGDAGADSGVETGDADAGTGCSIDADCDDGLFCNGAESCMPGSQDAAASGCVTGSPPCASGQICDELSASCKTACQINADADGDGFASVACGGADCDDSKATVAPGVPEACNGVDDDCDGQIDDGVTTTFYVDADGDGFGSAAPGSSVQACGKPAGHSSVGSDCNDASPVVFPGATESCNGLDDDCDGVVDEQNAAGCTLYFKDADGDGFGSAPAQCRCGPGGGYTASTSNDCDDNNASAHPGAAETCNGFDDNCDGVVDPVGATGCTPKYADQDQDGWGTTQVQCVCGSPFPFTASQAGDCCDFDANAKPGPVYGSVVYYAAPNACGSWDYNCNGVLDKEFPSYGSCSGYLSCQAVQGWVKPLVGGAIPDCGVTAEFVRTAGSQSCVLPTGMNYCSNKANTQVQRCR